MSDFQGYMTTVKLTDEAVQIRRKGLMAAGGSGRETDLALNLVVKVNYVEATPLANGSLQLVLATDPKAVKANPGDSNTIMFRRKQRDGMHQLRDALTQRAEANVAAGTAGFDGVTLIEGVVSSADGGGPVAGAHAVVEAAGDIRKRMTATRIIATGPVGLIWRKKVDDRELYLLVEGAGWAASVPVDPDRGAEARAFAAKINAAGSLSPAQSPIKVQAPGPLEQIAQLAALRDQGVLTAEEFDAKKTELLGRV